jgi:hypothetical protein
MKKQEYAFLIGFISAMFLFFSFFLLLEEQKKRNKKTFKKIADDLDRGFELDAENLKSDWLNIKHDFDISYDKLKKEYHYE